MAYPEIGSDQDRARRAAEVRSYSRAVRWMKIVLPLGALALIAAVFLLGRDRGAVIDLESAGNAAALSAGMRLENPRFAGVTEDGAPFVVTAVSALPDGAVPDRIDLDRPAGELRLEDGLTLNVTSEKGEMFRRDERLRLTGDVVLTTSDGYRLLTQRVDIDLATRSADAPGTVEATGPRGSIRADRVRVEDGENAVLRFDGNVRVTFLPGD